MKSQVDIAEKKEAEDDARDELRESLNNRISYLCRLAALILVVVIFTTTILGQAEITYVILGLSLAIALLAIAGLQGQSKPKR